MVHIDALRHDDPVPDRMPFLHELAQAGLHARLVPPFGFEPDGAYFTGTHPEEYDGGAHFVRVKDGSPLRFARYFPKFLDELPTAVQFPMRRLLRQWISLRGATPRLRKSASYFQVPFRLMPYFGPADIHFPYEAGFGGRARTLFDYLREACQRFYYHGALERDCASDRVLEDLRGLKETNFRFAFLFLSELDRVGHQYGPASVERHETAKRLDGNLRDIVAWTGDRFTDPDIIVFGDHGMVEVERLLDVESVLRQLPLQCPDDYLYFLDSTMVRFWFGNGDAKARVEDAMDAVEGLVKIDETMRKQYRIQYRDNRFGDTVYWAEGGCLVHPSFWNRGRPPVGMHGYPSGVKENHSFFAFVSAAGERQGRLEEIQMVDVFQTAMHSLGLEAGEATHGQPVQEMLIPVS